MSLSRRSFIGTSIAASGVIASAAESMPKRTFGKTGAKISILAFGCGSRWLAYKDQAKAVAVLNRALDLGVTYVDTAFSYGNGQSETWVGEVMKTRRKEVWLTTKVADRKGDEAMRTIEGSLKRLQTSQIDLVHIHSLTTEDDLAAIEASDGVFNALQKLKSQKVIRNVGISCHTDPFVLKKALERHDFDCTQMALNGAKMGNAANARPAGENSFENVALPVAVKKNMGIIAMKIFAQEKLNGKAPVEKLIQYSLSLPVAAVVIGMPRPEFVDTNITIAKSFKPMPKDEMRDLSNRLTTEYKASIDHYFRDHIDC